LLFNPSFFALFFEKSKVGFVDLQVKHFFIIRPQETLGMHQSPS